MLDEGSFKRNVLDKIEARCPEYVLIMKNDASLKQGIGDAIICYRDKWAILEFKRSEDARHRPNQDTYVDIANRMSFSRFIYPENEEEVLNELYAFFGV